MKAKELRAWLIILALNLIVVFACVWDSTHRETTVDEVVEESETELIQWKDTEELVFEEVVVETVTEPTEDEVLFYDISLSEELQLHIFAECEKHNIAPDIALAVMWMESRFQADVVSKYGDIGLMQVNPKWHWDRMERLGCNNLYDPYQNITVGIDFIAYLKEKNSDIVWVLTSYRWGTKTANYNYENGIICEYASVVLEKSSEFQRGIGDGNR